MLFRSLERGCSAETSTTDTLLHYARSAETVEQTKKHLKESRRTVNPSRLKVPPSSSKPTKVKEPLPTRSREQSRDRSDRRDQSCYRDRSRRYCYVPFHSSDSIPFSALILDSNICHYHYTSRINSLSFRITFPTILIVPGHRSETRDRKSTRLNSSHSS